MVINTSQKVHYFCDLLMAYHYSDHVIYMCFKNTIILFAYLPKFCISIAFIFSWDHSKSQEKMETMFMQKSIKVSLMSGCD